MFELAVIVIAIALLPFALAVAVPLTIFAVIVVTVLALAYQIMQGDPTLGNCNGRGFCCESYSRVDYERQVRAGRRAGC